MQVCVRWKRFRRRFRYWLDHSERNRLLWEELEFHIKSMIEELAAQGVSEPEARAMAHRKFGNMTHVGRRSLPLDRALDERRGAGPVLLLSRHAAQSRICCVHSDLAGFADWGVGDRQRTGAGEPDRLTSALSCGRDSNGAPADRSQSARA